MVNDLIKIAVVEDSSEDLANCLSLLERYKNEKGLSFEIHSFGNGDSFFMNYKGQYDFIILDVNLPYSNGIDIAKRIRSKDEEVIIMFATNLAKYATHGYEVNAIDFVLKPLTYPSFYLRLERVMNKLSKRDSHFLMLPLGGGFQKIDISEIYYVEVVSHDVIFHLGNNKAVKTTGTLKKIEAELSSHRFLRCNSCYLVNARKIKLIDKYDIYLSNDEVVAISHPKRKQFMEQFKQYVLEEGR